MQLFATHVLAINGSSSRLNCSVSAGVIVGSDERLVVLYDGGLDACVRMYGERLPGLGSWQLE